MPSFLTNLKRLSKSRANPYVAVLVLFALLGAALAYELKSQHDKLLVDVAQRAMQRSQFISQSLHSKLISTDYVLRDVLGRIQKKDLVYPDPDPKHLAAMINLLKEKSSTVPELFTMVFFNENCVFTALDTGQHMGAKSSPGWCAAAKAHKSTAPMVTFVPSSQSPSGVAVVAFSRIMLSPSGQFEGAAVSAMELRSLQKWIESIKINPDDAIAIIDQSRILLARNPLVASKIETSVSVPEVDELIRTGAPAVTSTREGVDGVRYILGFSKVEDFPFYVTYGFNESRVLEQWKLHSIELLISYLLIFLLAMVIVHLQVKAQRGRLSIEREKSKLEERESLLQDMHDGFGSQLASAHLMAQQGQMSQAQITQILQECMADLYLVMDTLSSSSNTFADVIADYRYRLERRLGAIALQFHWNIQLDPVPEVSPRKTLQLLRILQEAISNVLKHAQASNVWIDIAYLPQTQLLTINVADDGVGISPMAPRGRGFPGMKGRARAIGATISFTNRQNASGTQLNLSVNLS